jgi:preprotein translocase subunit YajC
MGILALIPSNEKILIFIVIILFVILLSIIGYYIYRVIKNEKKKKTFHQIMKVGDECYFVPIPIDDMAGIITQINEDTVEVKTIVQKRFIYPKEK